MEFQHEAVAFEKEQTRQDWYLNWISGRIGFEIHVHVWNGSQEREQIKLTWREAAVQKEITVPDAWLSFHLFRYSSSSWRTWLLSGRICIGGAIASSDSWDLLQRLAAFGAHSRCIQSAGSLYEIPASNLRRAHLIQKSRWVGFLMWVDILDFGWHSVFPGWCISGKGAAKEWVEELDPREEDWYSRRGEQKRMLQDLWEHLNVGSLIYPSGHMPSCTYFLFAQRRLWRQQKLKSRNFWHPQMSLAKFSGAQRMDEMMDVAKKPMSWLSNAGWSNHISWNHSEAWPGSFIWPIFDKRNRNTAFFCRSAESKWQLS